MIRLNKEDIRLLQSHLCDQVKKKGPVDLFCEGEDRTTCFEKNKWRLGNPYIDFAKGIEYTESLSRTGVKDGERSTKTCVYWN